jgi:prolyl-tRNA editing enzyme YbaK/EbsC (Cys-tRNA(Pro) deacylase)
MSLSSSAQKVQQALAAIGMQLKVVELPDSTRTSIEAAQAIGCQVGQIAKSIIFKALDSQRPILVIASGPNRVNEQLISGWIGEAIGKADADFVRLRTGFVIGGVPPVGHIEKLDTFIDQDLMQYPEIWAAAGTPHAVFQLTPADLLKMTRGKLIMVTGEAGEHVHNRIGK